MALGCGLGAQRHRGGSRDVPYGGTSEVLKSAPGDCKRRVITAVRHRSHHAGNIHVLVRIHRVAVTWLVTDRAQHRTHRRERMFHICGGRPLTHSHNHLAGRLTADGDTSRMCRPCTPACSRRSRRACRSCPSLRRGERVRREGCIAPPCRQQGCCMTEGSLAPRVQLSGAGGGRWAREGSVHAQ